MTKILKFYSPTCGPCKVIDSLLKQLKVEYYNINVYDPEYFTEDFVSDTLEDYEKDNDILTYYKITTVPTLLKLDTEGKIINKVTGVLTLEQLKEFLKD